MLNYDKVLSSIGEFGPYQKRLCFLLFVLAIPNGIHVTNVIFNNVTPSHRCAVPGLINDSFAIQDPQHERLVQAFIPTGSDGEQYSQCKTYDTRSQTNENRTRQCQSWVFDQSDGVVSQSVVFDLVCDRIIYKAHNSLMVLLGILVGSLLGGPLSDYFGRKKTLIAGLLISCSLAALMSVLQSIVLVMVCRFLVVMTSLWQFLAGFVLLAESVGINYRSKATVAAMLGYTAGLFLLTLVHFLFRDWRTAQLVQSLPPLALALFWWLIHESPRWLLTKDRQKEAQDVITHIAKVNGVTLTPETELVANSDMMKSRDEKDDDITATSGSKEMKIWHICTNARYAFYITILCFSWVTINMVYYGLVLGVGELIQGDIYVNFLLQAAMEVLSHIACVGMLERIDRKKFFCSSMIITGMATLGIGVLVLADQDIRWLSVTLYCLGKLCITIGFNLIYIITTELLPTKIRNSGLGFCSFVARFSGIVSPYIVSASLLIPGAVGKAFPVLLFGVLSVTSGLSAILLPETRNAKLPETLDGSEDSEV